VYIHTITNKQKILSIDVLLNNGLDWTSVTSSVYFLWYLWYASIKDIQASICFCLVSRFGCNLNIKQNQTMPPNVSLTKYIKYNSISIGLVLFSICGRKNSEIPNGWFPYIWMEIKRWISLFSVRTNTHLLDGDTLVCKLVALTSETKLTLTLTIRKNPKTKLTLECGPMPNVMVALPNIGGALCSTPQSLADAHY